MKNYGTWKMSTDRNSENTNSHSVVKERVSVLLLLRLLSEWPPVANDPDVLQPCGLLYYPQMFKLSPPVVFQEILAVRRGAKPYYFRHSTFHHQLSPQRSQQPKVELCGRKMTNEFCLKCPTSTQHSGIFYMP